MDTADRVFLENLAAYKFGRAAFTREAHGLAIERFSHLIQAGFIRNRPVGYDFGFQITPKGRAYLAGDLVE